MPLDPGTRLGPYEIQSVLGAGGMGEVYRAKDTRLDRIVAIKVLPSHVSDDPTFRERFEREARTVAALNHPHICTLYDVGRDDGTDFLVLEYLEGQTLAERLTKGALPLDHALTIGIQIADALAKAHRAGIVHRDLKPGNIMLGRRGGPSGPPDVKLLDFGLAKVTPAVVAASGLSIAPTGVTPVTMQGTLLGTLQYMAPEQIEGQEADARTDTFAFGAVLYEMLTGRKAFDGRSQASLIGAILKDEPAPLRISQPLASPFLDRVVRKCLAKDPNDRWQSAGDLRDELRWIGDARMESATVSARGRIAGARTWLLAVVGVLVVAAAIALGATAAMRFRSTPVDVPETRLQVVTPPTTDPISMAISPDGRRLAFVAAGDGPSRLWLRSLESSTSQPLAGTENALYPFWSADSRSIGFFAGNKLMRVDIVGGQPQAVVNAPAPRGGTWNNEGVILFAPLNAGGLFRVPASGGNAVAVTALTAGQTSQRFPQFLPDGRHFLYYAQGTAEAIGVYLASLDAPEGKRLTPADTAAGYLPIGGLLYVREGALIFQHLDTARGVLDGDPTTLADPVGFDAGFSVGAFSTSATGMVAYRTNAATLRQLTWLDRMGRVAGTVAGADENNALYPELSLDGRRLALSRTIQSNGDIWVYDISRGVPTRFTFDAGLDTSPIWSPDGSSIIFRSSRKGAYDLYRKPSSGAGEEVAVLVSPQSKFPTDWSPDGRLLLFQNLDPKNGSDLFVLPLEGDRKPSPFVQTPFDESQAQFSPDGRWVAYQSNESGRFEIVLVPFPRPTAKFQISTGGGAQPRWRRDGRELFYVAPDGRLMAVPIRAGASTLETDAPVPLFQTRIPSGSAFIKQQYAVASDGRFLLNNGTEESSASPITIVQNWKPPSR